MLIRAPAHVHSAHAALLLLGQACSPLPARSADWLDGPCFGVLLRVFGEIAIIGISEEEWKRSRKFKKRYIEFNKLGKIIDRWSPA